MDQLTSFEADAVERFARAWEALFERGDAGAMASFYAEDARLIATATATIEGRAAIERFWRDACAAARAGGLTRTVHTDRVDSADGLGYLRGTVRLSGASLPAAVTVRYVTVWRRQDDGAWRCMVDISSAAPPAT